ncbi:MAG: ribose 1,5-bisphosphate isomerase [Methanomassiliicoccales archaeon]|nr:ribose 1,5-bisphosphate isomerase [Methanomassiliicoccales archaeon]
MSLREVARSIRTMEIRGAGEIARAGANALKDFAQGYKGKDIDRFKNQLEGGKKLLLSTRPTAISLWNAMQTVTKGAKDSKDIEELRDLIVANADRFVSRSKEAVKIIGKVGSQRIKGGERILTHCNSKAALSVIRHAFRDGKKIEVTVTESRPWRQGLQTAKELAMDGIPTTLIIDSAVRWVMKDIDLVYVGADTIASNGAVINKIGTSQIALIAHEARVPFIVCAETFKFSPKTIYGELVEIEERDPGEIVKEGEIPKSVRIRNPVFDATPADYIDSIVTEVGVISPYAAYDIIVKELGQEIGLDI